MGPHRFWWRALGRSCLVPYTQLNAHTAYRLSTFRMGIHLAYFLLNFKNKEIILRLAREHHNSQYNWFSIFFYPDWKYNATTPDSLMSKSNIKLHMPCYSWPSFPYNSQRSGALFRIGSRVILMAGCQWKCPSASQMCGSRVGLAFCSIQAYKGWELYSILSCYVCYFLISAGSLYRFMLHEGEMFSLTPY